MERKMKQQRLIVSFLALSLLFVLPAVSGQEKSDRQTQFDFSKLEESIGNAEFLHLNKRSFKKLPTSIDQGSARNERADAPTDLALKEVQSAAEAFIKAFNNLDWEQFRNCFADDATVFFPSATMAAARANGRTEIEAIFKTLFDAARKRKDSPPYLNIEPKDTRIKVLGNAAVVTFHLGGKDSLGRRTIIFEKQKGRWLIVHIHASTMALSNETK
jgi:ketosteroid isomerase-like protein